MKIKSITDRMITFDNGAKMVQYCPFENETGYAAFSEIDKEALEFEFRKTIMFDVGYRGGIMFGSVKRMFFIPCYSKQSGYYSSDIQIYYNQRKVLDFDAKMA